MIRIIGLHKQLGGRPVLGGVNLDVREGETLAIMGPSGTGKSVLLKHIVGLFDPDAGDIVVDGISVPSADRDGIAEVRRKIAYVFQNSALFDSMTVRGNLLMGLPPGFCRSRMAECDDLALTALRHVNLEPEVLSLVPAELSGGMQRRVAIARAIIGKRRYVLYDEPTTGLDPVNATRINRLIAHVSREVDATSIVVTHDVESAFFLADRIVLLSDGVVKAEGTPEQLRATDNPAVRQFLDAAPGGSVA
ncbi:ABC transporter ATP-binding protein [Candidatus Palauibacter sp.]|uniref:ABC transporter ATP-binding protein n=1 Tax=Candidatus Palauibacter sp. TaxID=3101350 RepID=UPI003B01409D